MASPPARSPPVHALPCRPNPCSPSSFQDVCDACPPAHTSVWLTCQNCSCAVVYQHRASGSASQRHGPSKLGPHVGTAAPCQTSRAATVATPSHIPPACSTLVGAAEAVVATTQLLAGIGHHWTRPGTPPALLLALLSTPARLCEERVALMAATCARGHGSSGQAPHPA